MSYNQNNQSVTELQLGWITKDFCRIVLKFSLNPWMQGVKGSFSHLSALLLIGEGTACLDRSFELPAVAFDVNISK